MKRRIRLSMRIAAVAAATLLTSACDDSGSPTEPLSGVAGAWTGTYSSVSPECEAFAEATFAENRGSVSGQINVSRPCTNTFVFRGTFQGNELEGEFTDFWDDEVHFSGRGTLSGGTLEILLDGGSFGRMNFHR